MEKEAKKYRFERWVQSSHTKGVGGQSKIVALSKGHAMKRYDWHESAWWLEKWGWPRWVREWGWKGTEDSKKSLIFSSAGIWLCSNWATCFKDQQEAASALQEPESVANSQGPNLCQINKRITWDLGDGPQWYSELIQNCWLMKERSSFFHVCDFNCDIQLACVQASNA